ncbi:MAG: DNA polymerase III subunit alpha, partial [Hyphomicrobiales bacterium]|nr:DNA polymerase III subunit alpha [Hyphomicrobiales bacterium]
AAIVAARGSAPFADLGDFARRVDARAVNKRAIEQLAAAGAFDAISPDRAAVHAAADSIVREANSAREAALGGQGGLFGAEAPATLAAPRRDGPAVAWSAAERLRREFDAVGFFLTGHPLDDHAAAIRRLKLGDFAAFARAVHRGETTGRLAATVLDRQERRIKSGSKMGVFTLSDPSGHYEAITFQEGLDQWRDLLEKGADVAVTLQGSADGEEVRARIVGVETLDKAAARAAKGLRVFLRDEAPLPSVRERLARRGEGAVSLVLMLGPAEGEIEVKLPGGYAIGAEIAASLRATAGVVAVEVA